MTQLAKVKTGDNGEVVTVSESASLMEVINRAATDPNVDVEKMERLLSMYERISARSAKVAFHTALAEMQPKLPVITERGEIKHGTKLISKYALWEDINEAIRPILYQHGFALSFRVARDNQQVTVSAILSHREGHVEETTIALDADNSGSKNAVQAVGSSISYGQRYAASALLNITTQGRDDDGEKASNNRKRDYGEEEPVIGALNKTKLKTELREFDQQLLGCSDEDELHALLEAYKAQLEQCERDLPSWWWTKEGSDSLGIRDRIEKRKGEVKANPDDPRTYKGNQ